MKADQYTAEIIIESDFFNNNKMDECIWWPVEFIWNNLETLARVICKLCNNFLLNKKLYKSHCTELCTIRNSKKVSHIGILFLSQ